MKKLFILLIILFYSICLTAQTSSNPCFSTPTVIYGNKTYNTVQIANQCWLKENLDIGIMIKGEIDQTNNNVLEKYCYHDDQADCNTFGGLYTWNEAMKYSPGGNKAQGICPNGWHLPTLEELDTLAKAVNYDGNSLKEIGQGQGENLGAGTNTSGFSAMLAGSRGYGGHFSHEKVYIWLWSSTDLNDTYTNVLELDYSNSTINQYQNGKEAAFSVRCIKGQGITVVSENNNLPKVFSLSQNYPNPFNPTTIIKYSIPAETTRRNVYINLKVFDIIGREIATLVNEEKQPGNYEAVLDASRLSSGIYYYKLTAGYFTETKKMILIK